MARLPTLAQRLKHPSAGEPLEPVIEASELLVARRRRVVEGVPIRFYHAASTRSRSTHRAAWAFVDLCFVLLLAAVTVLNVSDVVITLAHVLDVGWNAEANPLARVAGVKAGPMGLILLKAVALGISIPVMWYVYRIGTQAALSARAIHERESAESARRTMLGCLLGLALFYTWVIQNNLRVVGVFRTVIGLFGL